MKSLNVSHVRHHLAAVPARVEGGGIIVNRLHELKMRYVEQLKRPGGETKT